MREYTVKKIADILKVSKPTVQRAINAAAIEADRVDNKNTRYYYAEKTNQIIKLIKADFDILEADSVIKSAATNTETPPQTPPNDAKSGETPPQTPPNDAKQTETKPKQTETPPQNNIEVELLRDMLNTIKEQLVAKDKQIEAYEAQIAIKDEQIKDYTNRLQEALQITKGQQYITAADKTTELIEAQNKNQEEVIIDPAAADPEPQKKKSIFDFFKRK